MIDTLRLMIPRAEVSFVSGLSNMGLYSKTENYEKFVRNPSKTEKEMGLYFPRITGYRRGGHKDNAKILVEFSAPKLLFLNNVDELEDGDFEELIRVLRERLGTMGIIVMRTTLEKSLVSAVHFSKNILLKDGYTASHLISEMNKVDLNQVYDFTRSRYINDGQSLYAHTTSHQLVIYDKVADISKGEKRAIDKDQPSYQISLFPEIQKNKQEIIRFEVRLGNRQKIDRTLEALGYERGLSFRQIFKSEISQKVVNDYWQKLIKSRNLGLFSVLPSIKDILRIFLMANEKLKPKQAIYLLGLFLLARDENGLRELRSMVSKRAHDRTWYRFTRDMRRNSDAITKNGLRSWVTQIDEELKIYKPFKVKQNEEQSN